MCRHRIILFSRREFNDFLVYNDVQFYYDDMNVCLQITIATYTERSFY